MRGPRLSFDCADDGAHVALLLSPQGRKGAKQTFQSSKKGAAQMMECMIKMMISNKLRDQPKCIRPAKTRRVAL